MATLRFLVLSFIAVCGLASFSRLAAADDFVVISNRTPAPAYFTLEALRSTNGKQKLRSGQSKAFRLPGPRELALAGPAPEPTRYLLQPGSIYFIHRRVDGQLLLAEIALTNADWPLIAKPGRAPPAPVRDQKLPAFPQRDERGALVISVKLLVDDEEPASSSHWERRLRNRLTAASRVFEETCAVRFESIAVGVWNSDDGLRDFAASRREFERAIDPHPAHLAIGFSSQYAFGSLQEHGESVALARHLLIAEHSQNATESERCEMLVHQLGHLLGAMHSPESNSVMRPALGDGQARSRHFPIGFDPLNALAMSLVAQEIGDRNCASFAELSASTRLRLRDVYATVLEATPDDWTARGLLDAVGDPTPINVASVRAAAEHDEASASPTAEAARLASSVEPVRPLAANSRAVLSAIVACGKQLGAGQADPLAADRPQGIAGDDLFIAYVRAAAMAATQTSGDDQVLGFFLGLAIGLDRTDALRKYAVMGDLVREIESDSQRNVRLRQLGAPTLGGRQDLLQHFVLSAAIARSSGAQSAESVALAKQLHAAQFGDGFSFSAWCADLAGIAFAARVANDPMALQTISQRFRIDDVLPELPGLPDRLSEREFKRQFGSTSDARFKRVDAEIRSGIEKLMQSDQP